MIIADDRSLEPDHRKLRPELYCLEGGKMRALLLLAIAFGLIGGVSLGFCRVRPVRPANTAPPGLDSIEIHQLFFERVARSNPQSPFTFQNDLTDGEMAIVNNVAVDCDSKLGPLSDQPVRWEALMRSLESGEEQEVWLNQHLIDLKARRKRVVGTTLKPYALRSASRDFKPSKPLYKTGT